MEFVILGRTALHRDGRAVDLGAAKERALLALLLFHVRTPVRADTLVQQLWPDVPRARSSLYAPVSRLRRVLDGVGLADALVRVDGGGAYRLDIDAGLIDYHRFRRLVIGAREVRTRAADAAAMLGEAIGLWRGEPLADLRGPYVEQLRNHLHDALVDAHKLLADCQLRLGQPDPVLERLEPFVLDRELDESLAQLWIRALCAAGRVDDARAHLRQFRRRFRRQLRVDPHIEMPVAPQAVAAAPVAPRPVVAGSFSVRPVVPRQLPLDVAHFTGHEALLRDMDHALLRDADDATGRTAVVVLSGMPGVGKTTLAVHWAHRNRDRFPDGQLYLNANAFGTGAAVEPVRALGRFLAALGVAAENVPGDAEERRDLLNDLLADKRIVLVVDNVGNAEQVRPLIPTTGRCVTIVTSRNRLRGLSIREGARCITVPPLPVADSTTLLTAVVGAARAAADPDGIGELVRLTGGLPLALRIVGEHVAERSHVPVADLAGELSRQLLNSDGDDEEAALETVFAWSYDALRPADARLFRLLGLFPGATIGVEAAAAMAGEPLTSVHSGLRGLARAHLINHDAVGRFRMHDLLKRYATDRAEEDPRAAVRRLIDFYLWTLIDASRVLAPDCPTVPDLAEPDGVVPLTFDTDAAAVAWCGAERATIAPLTRLAMDLSIYRPAWQLVGTAHELYDRYGRQDDVLELCALGLEAARRDGHREGQLGSLINQASTYFAMREYDDATASLTAALRLAQESNDPDLQAICLHNLTSVHLATGQAEAAIAAFTEVLAICRRTGNTVGESSTLHRLGGVHQRLGRYAEATAHYAEALAIRTREHAVRGQGETHAALAALHHETGDHERALDHCRQAIDLATRMHDDVVRCDALITAAHAALASGRLDEAVGHARTAAEIGGDIGDVIRRARALVALVETTTAARGKAAADPLRAEATVSLEVLPADIAEELRGRLARLQ